MDNEKRIEKLTSELLKTKIALGIAMVFLYQHARRDVIGDGMCANAEQRVLDEIEQCLQ